MSCKDPCCVPKLVRPQGISQIWLWSIKCWRLVVPEPRCHDTCCVAEHDVVDSGQSVPKARTQHPDGSLVEPSVPWGPLSHVPSKPFWTEILATVPTDPVTIAHVPEQGCPCCLENTPQVSDHTLPGRKPGAKSQGQPAPAHPSVQSVCCGSLCCAQPSSRFTDVLRSAKRLLATSRSLSRRQAVCCPQPTREDIIVVGTDAGDSDHGRQVVTMTVAGMDCPACTLRVERALKCLPSVEDVKVSCLFYLGAAPTFPIL